MSWHLEKNTGSWLHICEVFGTLQGKDSSEMHIEMLMILQRIADLHPNMQINTLFPPAQAGLWLILRTGLPWPVTSLINSQGWLFSVIRNIFLIRTPLYKEILSSKARLQNVRAWDDRRGLLHFLLYSTHERTEAQRGRACLRWCSQQQH